MSGACPGKERLMRRVSVLTAAVLLACSMAQAEVHIYNFPLDGPQADATRTTQSPGTGQGHVTYDDATNQMSWTISYQNLLAPVTNAHFHGSLVPPSTYGVDAGVQVPQQQVGGQWPNPMTGSATLTANQETMLLGGLFYFNIHTQFDTSGEIRGQVVPEPATIGLLSIGALGLLARRRRV